MNVLAVDAHERRMDKFWGDVERQWGMAEGVVATGCSVLHGGCKKDVFVGKEVKHGMMLANRCYAKMEKVSKWQRQVKQQ